MDLRRKTELAAELALSRRQVADKDEIADAPKQASDGSAKRRFRQPRGGT